MDLNIQLQILCKYINFPIYNNNQILSNLRCKVKSKQLFPVLGQY